MNEIVHYQTTPAQISYQEMEKMAAVIANSGLFGVKNSAQALALMLVAQSEGLHPATAARDYHVIQGRPAMKADAMLAKFQAAGGKVEWLEYTATVCRATFSHPSGGKVTVEWTGAMAQVAGLTNKEVWKQFPRAMLRARVISEGIRTVYPAVLCGMYTPEEVRDIVDVPGSAETSGPDISSTETVSPPQAAWTEFPPLDEIRAKLAKLATVRDQLAYWQSLKLNNAHPRFSEIKAEFSAARNKIEADPPATPPYNLEDAEFTLESIPTAAERNDWLAGEKTRMGWKDDAVPYVALRNIAADLARKEKQTKRQRPPLNSAPGKAATPESLAAAGFMGGSTPFDDSLDLIA